MPRTKETTLELDLAALEHNYNYIRTKIHPSTMFLAVVKAFAYGTDSVIIAKKLEKLRVDYMAVAYAHEGKVLREAGIKTPILVLHAQPSNYTMVIKYCLEPSLYSPRTLREFIKTAKTQKQKDYPVHLKFNTGLNRLGFWENDINYIADQLVDREELKIKSIFSHLAASEDKSEEEFSKNQIKSFEKIAEEFTSLLKISPFMHILNTSGIFNYPEAQFQMVRSGIGLYGYGNEARYDAKLLPVATLKTIISQIHNIEPNESVGYNRAFTAEVYKKTATLPLGHADGIGRQYGNGKASVLVNGKEAPIIGNVCMDMIMIDITGIECKEGDEVIVFGKGHSAEAFAAGAKTISYEILSAISQRVKRVITGA
ncbi:alanine racemase [uncultured Eudoraea sp.]|uniref:alanine racemase n=1 Tax=uncultured Eudoraea sp. TaxID=1035614 RepID=UPI0026145036|nr:alanine racemase [uncultured Eudoraea sp.]